jgi:Fe-S oxidoreductase/nitrate reductase gamma subunit
MFEETAGREIMWNVTHPANVVVMYSMFVASLMVGFAGIFRHAELWSSGNAASGHTGRWAERFGDLFREALMQRGTVKRKVPAVAHTLIYFGFIVLLFTTTMVLIDHDFGIKIYQGEFYLAVTLLSDLFGLGLILGCLIAMHRRYIRGTDLLHNRLVDSMALIILIVLCVQGFLLEGLRIHATNDPWALYSPVGLLVAKFFWFLSYESAALLHFITWWFHTTTVFAVIAVIPYTKFFHIFSSSANLYFKRSDRQRGEMENPGDLEKMMEEGEDFTIGRGTIKDYTWKELLDLDACTSCGRCQDACPAYMSGKVLSPKWMILDSRNHALTLQADGKLGKGSLLPGFLRWLDRFLTHSFFLKNTGLTPSEEGGYNGQGDFRAANPRVQKAAKHIGRHVEDKIAGDVMDKDVFWSCTTCYACVEACPVGINHVDQILGNRRHLALMEGELPAETTSTMRALENRGNPFGAPEDRIKWLADLEVPILQEGDSVDYLYWVGCVSSYDPRKQKIARALVTIMKRAGLSFGVLGTAEGCTGDPARRLGEENLFQSLAKTNIETLSKIKFETMVANCPHCFNTIKNEYPQFGNLGNGRQPEIIHHSTLLRNLLRDGKLTLKPGEEEWTFHDPCYLGRYNNEYDAPRDTLKSAKGLRILEMDRSREKAMCCGAGGGHFWMDMEKEVRVNNLRVEQAEATGAKKIATACPFCLQMMEDGVKNTNKDEELQVKDIAEVIAEKLN